MNRLSAHGLAILAVLFAALARDELIPIFGVKFPFITFYPAVAFAGWFGGLGPGLVATFTGTALVSLATRSRTLDFRDPGDLVALTLFTAVNIFFSVVNEALHRARRRAEVQGMEARSREERLAREIQARAEVEASLSRAMSEAELDRRLYRRKELPLGDRPAPDFAYLHTELRRRGVTLELLHHEYLERYPDGYRYSQFCERHRRWMPHWLAVL